MQTLDVISVNLWLFIISLLNLVILFLIIKKFLYKPVKAMLAARQGTVDKLYDDASEAKQAALSDKKEYEQRLEDAKGEADEIIQSAVATARAREAEIIGEAKEEAAVILTEARENAALEMKKAEESIKDEIVDVSTRLTEKLLEREINAEDHKVLIDAFIDSIGDEDDRDQ